MKISIRSFTMLMIFMFKAMSEIFFILFLIISFVAMINEIINLFVFLEERQIKMIKKEEPLAVIDITKIKAALEEETRERISIGFEL